MTAPPLPYFFDEAERASNAKQPGEREKALNFTLDDLKWLKGGVYLATHEARTTQKAAMQIDRLMLQMSAGPDIPLAGAFCMSRPNKSEVILYTPWKGLVKFADMTDLTTQLERWLSQASDQQALLRYLSIEQRSTASATTGLTVSTQKIEGAAFQDQEQTLDRNQTQNIQTMLAELVKMPSLQSMLDETLKIALAKRFPKLDQRRTQLDSYIDSASPASDTTHPQNRRKLSSLSLSDALLHVYLTNQWPDGDIRTFSNPGHGVSNHADNQAWEREIKEIAQSFTPRLQSLLETFWNAPMSDGQSRSDFFAESLRDTYHVDLLLKRQQGILTTAEYLELMSVSGAEPAPELPLRVEKVRVSALYKHYVELASTFMSGNSDTLGYLYTHSSGIQASTDLAAIKDTALAMLRSEGHEDNLLNFMSLDERDTFLSLEPQERLIIGEPITGQVFEQLIEDVRAKQLQNLTYALSRYRESEGTLNVHALLDKALDVRGLIDNRLLTGDANGRWSTRADQRWSARPATVRAESAKEQLASLSTVKQALEHQLDQHPSISVTTFAAAQTLARSSLEQLQPKFVHTLSTALRSEHKLLGVARALGTTELAMIKTLFETPVRLQRGALNGFLPDVFSLALKADDTSDVLKLASCFVLTERGGQDPTHSGKAILWTPASGFEAFTSLTPLLTAFKKRLQSEDDRPAILENLERSQRTSGRTFTLAPLQLIHEDFLDHIQKPFVRLDQISVERALASSLPAPTLKNLLNLVALHTPKTGLRRATDLARSLATQQKLPVWLAKASIQDQVLHAELLQQYLNNAKDDKDYLTGVRSLERTAQFELKKLLKADRLDIDPDNVQVQVASPLTSGAKTLTLSAFALTHFHELDNADFKLVSLTSTAVPAKMDKRYIKSLIRKLDVGQLQQKIVTAAFAETNTSAKASRQLFAAQLPWQLLHYAHSLKLQERLSETGFDFIRQVMDMPDAIAREAVDGANAIIRPLEILYGKGLPSIKVPGIYLIGPKPNTAGPQVLIAPYSPGHGVKEYENEHLLLTELKSQGPLHSWVRNSLSHTDRTHYDSHVTSTTASGEVNLASKPIRGDLFKHLFNANVECLARLLGTQSLKDAQGDWETIKRVLGDAPEQAFTFLLGKLAYPTVVWHSYSDFKASAEDLQQHKWGPAIKSFISGIAQLAMLRQSMESQAEPSAAASEPSPPPTSANLQWRDIAITDPVRTGLQSREHVDADLGSMTRDATLGLYTHPTTKKKYAPVEGKVYPLEKRGKRWRISSSGSDGPYVVQNASKQWVREPEDTQARQYSLSKRLKTWSAVRDGMNVEANGMAEIRRLFPVRARLIDESLDFATTYAWNSFRNLQLLKKTGDTETPVHQLIKRFLDVPAILPAHVAKIEKVVEEILSALVDPTLRNEKSKRFVTGRVHEHRDITFGFTIPVDQEKKIYLAEKFFMPYLDHYRNYLTDASFPIRAHARATTLIHELSHVICNAEDIVYLDCGRPFVDLIDTTTTRGAKLSRTLTQAQEALSNHTPLYELFTVLNAETNVWEDFGKTSHENTDYLHQQILSLTGKKTLAEARTHFKKDATARLAVQLANADSIAWLITHLGRQLHVDTP
ncbi:hypothetical protein LOY38_15530 [Pseudomonas sp. B21-015]|uniref:dermonecrotic toxin domain-containing protein n=1 Tax=Pseudomonas sp. B21-015 TaxID=2895473 RepID=UPI0021603384|nr:DUF6543 domain-containing protein [Pseudomonas sp. B21-015]UVM47845.1 hypothetical protein LOY38_15530 [Pseudomonas sp. B21-015]